ncbi:MAG: MATE family efflux transporter [Marinilabiliaceae bacterium]|nr:MATE family efflux transporter [Marinilabiliaceae bacterium]
MTKHAKNIYELENESIPKLILRYFGPAFASVVIHSLYNIVDRIFIGQGVGALALSGLSAIFPIMTIMIAFGMLIGMGAGVRVSINLGKKDFDRAEKVLGNALILVFIISLIITILGFAIKAPLLRFFGVNAETYGYAEDYLDIILAGTIFSTVGYSMNNIIRSEGSARTAMYSMMISAGLNIVLDPVFIFWFKMGVKGAAYATVISQFALFIWVVRHFNSKYSIIKYRKVNFRIQKDIAWNILSIGFAPFLMQLASSVVFGTFNVQLIKFGGDIAIGAMGIIMSIAMLMVMTIFAVNMSVQPIIGFNYGARNYIRVRQSLYVALVFGTIISLLGFAVAELFPKIIIQLFNTNNDELLAIGIRGLRIYLMALPIVGFQIITELKFQI